MRPPALLPLLLLAACAGSSGDAAPATGDLASSSTFQPLLDSAGVHRFKITNVRYLAVRHVDREGLHRPLLRETYLQR